MGLFLQQHMSLLHHINIAFLIRQLSSCACLGLGSLQNCVSIPQLPKSSLRWWKQLQFITDLFWIHYVDFLLGDLLNPAPPLLSLARSEESCANRWLRNHCISWTKILGWCPGEYSRMTNFFDLIHEGSKNRPLRLSVNNVEEYHYKDLSTISTCFLTLPMSIAMVFARSISTYRRHIGWCHHRITGYTQFWPLHPNQQVMHKPPDFITIDSSLWW